MSFLSALARLGPKATRVSLESLLTLWFLCYKIRSDKLLMLGWGCQLPGLFLEVSSRQCFYLLSRKRALGEGGLLVAACKNRITLVRGRVMTGRMV